MWKGRLGLGLLVWGALATSAWALTYTGSISYLDGAQISPAAPSPWDDAVLSWEVTAGTDSWTYKYTWSDLGSPQKNVSHFSIEVSSNFTAADLLSWEFSSGGGTIKELEGPKTHNELAGGIYGYKWETEEYDDLGIYGFTLTLASTRAPMWGDFYLKGGMFQGGANGNGGMVWLANLGFGSDTMAAVANGNADGWVLVPNSKGGTGGGDPIPEPGTMLLLGTGLLGIARLGRRSGRRVE